MKRLILGGLAFALASTPALSQDRRNDGTAGHANPGAVVAEELAFARLAQEKGQWTAFRETATKDAVMFVPQMVYAQEFLKDKPNPPKPVTWQPHQVWSSCDGSLAVTRGAWQRPDGTSGWFTTVWQKQKNGRYKWVLDQGDALPMPLDPPDMIVSKVADCPPGYRGRAPKAKDFKGKLAPLDPVRRIGQSLDGTMGWEAVVQPDGARRFTVAMQVDGQRVTVQDVQVEAPAK
ncbi:MULTISPECIES: hypothetical protein [unclassified Novosphingobium]|uniref:hypothetical protein n=1 Tax=unclassified Novosphingobium TaxID=2644732 RepID=UPI0025E82E65|nr:MULTISPECIES: hypothetical protein [unclassified Novosphingobium]HQV04539.1 hypothetical protein [Novosphingobium sp.]